MALKTKAKNAVKDNSKNTVSDLCLEFARLPVNEPFLRSNYGKMSCSRGYISAKELKEESIETILSRMPQ